MDLVGEAELATFEMCKQGVGCAADVVTVTPPAFVEYVEIDGAL